MPRRMLIAFAALSLFMGPVAADFAKPKPYRGGDYWIRNENTWVAWEVSAAEVPGRRTPQWPTDFQEPGALLHIDWRIGRWPVVHNFSKGERLRALPDGGGGVIVKDIDGSSWLRVQLEDGQICFVRANARFLKPVPEDTARRGPDRPPAEPGTLPSPSPQDPAAEATPMSMPTPENASKAP